MLKQVKRGLCCCQKAQEQVDEFLGGEDRRIPRPTTTTVCSSLEAPVIQSPPEEERVNKVLRKKKKKRLPPPKPKKKILKKRPKPKSVLSGPPLPLCIDALLPPKISEFSFPDDGDTLGPENDFREIPHFAMDCFVGAALEHWELTDALEQLRQERLEEMHNYMQIVTRLTSRSVMELFIDHALEQWFGPGSHHFERRDSDTTFGASLHSMEFFLDEQTSSALEPLHERSQPLVDTTPASKKLLTGSRHSRSSSKFSSGRQRPPDRNPQDCSSKASSSCHQSDFTPPKYIKRVNSTASDESENELEFQMSQSAWLDRYRKRLSAS